MPNFKLNGMQSLYSDGVFYDLKNAAEAAIECLLWSEEPDGEDWSRKYVSKELTWSVIMDIADFCSLPDVQEILERNRDKVQFDWIGHNLYLSANGHGTGFWDRDNLSKEDLAKLHEWSKVYTRHVYVDEDDMLRSE